MHNIWIELCVNSMHQYIPQDVYASKTRFIQIGSHASSVAKFSKEKIYDDEILRKVIDLFNLIGLSYDALGFYSLALEHHTEALTICEKCDKKGRLYIAQTYNCMGIALHHLRKPDEALIQYKQALSIYQDILGENNEKTANLYNNIAIVWNDKRSSNYNYNTALFWFNKALKITIDVLGEYHEETAKINRNLGCLYNSIGDYEKALRLHKKALYVRRKNKGDHPYTAQSYNDIGDVLYKQNDYYEALHYYQEALTIRETILGIAHPRTINSYRNIASIYQVLTEFEKSAAYFKKAEDAYLQFNADRVKQLPSS